MNFRTIAPGDWTEADFRKLLTAVDTIPGHYCQRRDDTIRRAHWWRAYLHLARESRLTWRMLRRSTRGDLTPSGVLTFTTPETGELRAVRLTTEAMQAIAELPKRSTGYLLRLATPTVTLLRHWRKIVKAAGLSPKRFRFSHRSYRPEAQAIEGAAADSTVRAFFQTCYLPLKLRNRSERTKELYERTLRSFDEHLGHEARLCDLLDDSVTAHLSALTAKGLRPHTVEKERCQLLAIWRFACQRRLVELYPTIQRGRLPERKPVAWTIVELQRIFAAVDKLDGRIGTVPAAAWFRALLLVLYDTGERIAAVMQVTRANLDLQGRWLTIPAELRKGKTRDMLFRLHEDTAAALQAIVRADTVNLFPWPYGYTYLWNRYETILKAAGLPSDERCKFHRIRRTTASYFERGGGNATELLDHSSRSVTRRYLDPRIVERQQASDTLPRPKRERKGGAV